ncbi:GNAT family N-acetyltransferase [Puniceibacterium sp. IMCC21224]|uniref:GNAT family N-acetyltransferase n=1 Tax=Puniceibacterium sp. IMCC21224 TaxID=1618204 RepID=UPI00065CE7EA|nr:GNAT family N-acetyltransferase [Puniceibacterium sp. IMCC21224]KMK66776.1 Acetyltransferase (GNAT) domain [Puniceibacterium sp. IMCC21224]
MRVILRPARSTDAGKLGEMISSAVRDNDWKPQLHSAVEDIVHAGQMIDHGWVTVAARGQGGAVVGFIARNEDYVHALYIHPNTRGDGVGRMLIEDAQAASDRLELWTFEANAGARKFYEREGFTADRRTDGADNDEGLPDILYVWERKPPVVPTRATAQTDRSQDPQT